MTHCFTCDSTRVTHVCVLFAFSFAALISVICRLWARKIKVIRLELNDYLCIAGLIFALALTLLTIHALVFPLYDPGNPNAGWGDKELFVGELLWVPSVTLIRASILTLYSRIFPTPLFRTACHLVQVFNLAYFVAVVLAWFLICEPLAFFWDPSIDGFCGNQKSLDIYSGVLNLLMDVTTVALPMPVLWGLQMRKKQKILISGMFSMGIAICVITVVRIKITAMGVQNQLHEYAAVAPLTCLEALLGVINACLPVMKPIFHRLGAAGIFNSFRTRTRNTPNKNSGRLVQKGEGRICPRISLPRQIVNKQSLHIFSPDLLVDFRALSIPPPTFTWRPLSRLYLPRPEWDHDTSRSRKEKEIAIMTDWGFGRRPSKGDSPTSLWQP